jgi:hypothetical protein
MKNLVVYNRYQSKNKGNTLNSKMLIKDKSPWYDCQ